MENNLLVEQPYEIPREERGFLAVCLWVRDIGLVASPERTDHGFPGAEMLNPGGGDCVDKTCLLQCQLGYCPLTTAGPGTWCFLICRQEKQMKIIIIIVAVVIIIIIMEGGTLRTYSFFPFHLGDRILHSLGWPETYCNPPASTSKN